MANTQASNPANTTSFQPLHVVGLLLVVAGIAALGWAVGWLTGSAAHDAKVLAAILPAIISVVGGAGAALIRRQSDVNPLLNFAAGLCLLAFSLALIFGSSAAAFARERDEKRAFDESVSVQFELQSERKRQYFQDLQDCTTAEIRINDVRSSLGLEPYSPEQVCQTIRSVR